MPPEPAVSVPGISTGPNFAATLPVNLTHGLSGAPEATSPATNLIAIVVPPSSIVSSNVRVVVLIRADMLAPTLKPAGPALTSPENWPAMPSAVSRNAPLPLLIVIRSVEPVAVSATSTLTKARRVSWTGALRTSRTPAAVATSRSRSRSVSTLASDDRGGGRRGGLDRRRVLEAAGGAAVDQQLRAGGGAEDEVGEAVAVEVGRGQRGDRGGADSAAAAANAAVSSPMFLYERDGGAAEHDVELAVAVRVDEQDGRDAGDAGERRAGGERPGAVVDEHARVGHEIERAVAVEVAERERLDVAGEDRRRRGERAVAGAQEQARVGRAADDQIGVPVAVDVADRDRLRVGGGDRRRGGRVEPEPGRADAAAVQVHARGAGVDDDQVDAVVVVDVRERDGDVAGR